MNRLQLHYQTASKPDNANDNDSNSSKKKQKNDESSNSNKDNSNSSNINDNINDLSHYIDPKTRHIKQLSRLKKMK